jgi:hypothetical protein
LLHFRLKLFKPAHNSHQRTLMQSGRKCVQLIRSANRVSFHAAIVQVSDPSCYADSPSLVFDEIAEPNTLHSAGNQPAPRRLVPGRPPAQWICPEESSLSTRAGFDSIAFLTASHR